MQLKEIEKAYSKRFGDGSDSDQADDECLSSDRNTN
jgi:hypothetical protein